MMRQTGGCALGDISTKSTPWLRAMSMEEFAKRINDEVAAQLAATDIHPND